MTCLAEPLLKKSHSSCIPEYVPSRQAPTNSSKERLSIDIEFSSSPQAEGIASLKIKELLEN